MLSISKKQKTLVIKLKRDDGQLEETKLPHQHGTHAADDGDDDEGHAQWEEDDEEADEEVDIMG